MGINLFDVSTEDTKPRRKLPRAIELLQEKAVDTTTPIYSAKAGWAKLLAAGLGGLLEGAYNKSEDEADARSWDRASKAVGLDLGSDTPQPTATPLLALAAGLGAPQSANKTGAPPSFEDATVPIGSSRDAAEVPIPDQYRSLVQQTAVQHGLSADTFARQLNQESGFKPDATSPAGAQGIAQFMPATAKQYGVDPNDPNSAIPGAGQYMADLTKQFGGNTGLALAGYNWGPGNVSKWIAGGGDPSKIPAETRNYVQSITGKPIEDWTGLNANAQAGPDVGPMPADRAPVQTGGGIDRAAAAAALRDPRGDPRVKMLILQRLQPEYGFTTTPNGDIIRTDKHGGTATQIYQTPVKPEYKVIGESADGSKQYGWVNQQRQSVTPYQVPGSGMPSSVTTSDGRVLQIPPGQDPKKFREHVTAAEADARAGKLTEVQANATQFANRMEDAEKNVRKFAPAAQSAWPNLARWATDAQYSPIGRGALNWSIPKEYEQFEQGKSQFITALLRKESGAAINRDEFTRYDREFFPQIGDSPEVMAQKAQAREVAINAMKKGAGPIYQSPAAAPQPSNRGGTTQNGVRWSIQ